MKRNTPFVKILVLGVCMLMSMGLISGCGGTSQKEEQLVLQWVQWSGGPQRADGTRSYWDPVSASYAKVNVMQVIYHPFDEKGKTIHGLPTITQYRQAMEHAKYDLEKSKELGIGVIGYSDTVQFSIDNLKTEYKDIKLEDLCAVDYRGKNIFTTAWHPDGLYIACINKPKWRELLKENVYETAKAGFIGLQYDFHPYAAASYFCFCNSCMEGWKAYSKKVLGEEKPMQRYFDFSTEVSRAYFRWKIECFADFMKETGSKAKEYNPDFQLLMNHNINGYDMPLEILLGAIEVPTSEYWGVDNGIDSSLYMYQLAEALGKHDVYAVYNTAAQCDPIFRYKVNLAESYAVCGGMSFVDCDEGVAFFNFVHKRPQVYAGTHSLAKVGLMYSWESSLYSDISFNYNTLYYDYANDITRQAATALVKAGVVYDYLALEYDGVLNRMKQYDVLVIPEYDYFSKETWEKPLKQFSASGGKLIVLGNNSKKFVQSVLGDNAQNVYYVPDFTATSSDKALNLTESFLSSLEAANAKAQLQLLNNEDCTTATIRQKDSDIYIHVIRRGNDETRSDRTQSLKYKVPEGFKVKDVKVECPFTTLNVSVNWNLDDNGYLNVSTGDFDTYLLITVVKDS